MKVNHYDVLVTISGPPHSLHSIGLNLKKNLPKNGLQISVIHGLKFRITNT